MAKTFVIIASLLLSAPALSQGAPQYDLLIANGTIIDGTGSPRYRGDVAITGDRIVRVERGSILEWKTERLRQQAKRLTPRRRADAKFEVADGPGAQPSRFGQCFVRQSSRTAVPPQHRRE